MTIAEWILIVAVCYVLHRALFPLQRKIESILRRTFRYQKQSNVIIDITDYKKQTQTQTKEDAKNGK